MIYSFTFVILLIASLLKNDRVLVVLLCLPVVYTHPVIFNWDLYPNVDIALALMTVPAFLLLGVKKDRLFSSDLFCRPSTIGLRNFFLISFAACSLFIELTTGLSDFLLNKLRNGQEYDTFSRVTILWYASGALFAVFQWHMGHGRSRLAAMVPVVLFILSGDRTQPILILMVIFCLGYCQQKLTFKVYLASGVFACLLLIGKTLYIFLFTGIWTLAFTPFGNAIGYSESVSLMHYAELSFEQSRNLDFYLHRVFLVILPISFTDIHVFQREYKDTFFSDWSSAAGAGGNIISEIYWSLGWAGFLLSGGLYVFLISVLASRRWNIFGALWPILVVFFSFYIWRNSLFSMISHEKKFIYLFFLGVLFLSLKSLLIKKGESNL